MLGREDDIDVGEDELSGVVVTEELVDVENDPFVQDPDEELLSEGVFWYTFRLLMVQYASLNADGLAAT